MANDTLTVNVEYKDKSDLNKISEGLIPFGVEYELVSSKTQKLSVVNFEAGVPVKMTGLLANKCMALGNGTVKFYDPNEVKKVQEKEELDSLKKKVEILLKDKEFKKHKQVVDLIDEPIENQDKVPKKKRQPKRD